jgi:5-methyltetrahydrofolate--homocysteine methyltransferase
MVIKPRSEAQATEATAPATPEVVETHRSETVAVDIVRPVPPFWGTQVLQGADIPMAELYEHLDLQALIAGQWQFRKPREQSKEKYDAFLAETVYPILERWKQRIVEEELLQPQAIYGYFPCQAEGILCIFMIRRG